jgi:hypothetical protein
MTERSKEVQAAIDEARRVKNQPHYLYVNELNILADALIAAEREIERLKSQLKEERDGWNNSVAF